MPIQFPFVSPARTTTPFVPAAATARQSSYLIVPPCLPAVGGKTDRHSNQRYKGGGKTPHRYVIRSVFQGVRHFGRRAQNSQKNKNKNDNLGERGGIRATDGVKAIKTSALVCVCARARRHQELSSDDQSLICDAPDRGNSLTAHVLGWSVLLTFGLGTADLFYSC